MLSTNGYKYRANILESGRRLIKGKEKTEESHEKLYRKLLAKQESEDSFHKRIKTVCHYYKSYVPYVYVIFF